MASLAALLAAYDLDPGDTVYVDTGRNFSYALQWFAMGVVLAGLLTWNYRKRGL